MPASVVARGTRWEKRRRFSSTVSPVATASPPTIWCSPIPTRQVGGVRVTSRPRKPMRPAQTGSRPDTARRVVVLPAPLAPSSTATCPSSTVRLASNTA